MQNRKLTANILKKVSVFLFILYLAVLMKLLFFKITINFYDIAITDNHNVPFQEIWAASNFIPLYKIYYYASGKEPYLVGAMNVFGNILLFVPMGFFLPYFFRRIKTAKQLLLIVVVMGLLIETLQLLTATGEFDVDDVLLNTTGAMIGYYLFCRTRKLFVNWL